MPALPTTPRTLHKLDPVGLGGGAWYRQLRCSPVSLGTRVEKQSLRPALYQEGDRAVPPEGLFQMTQSAIRQGPKGPNVPALTLIPQDF